MPPGYTRFTAVAGIDNAAAMQNAGASVEFMVFTSDPSGPAPGEKATVPVRLSDLGSEANKIFPDVVSTKN